MCAQKWPKARFISFISAIVEAGSGEPPAHCTMTLPSDLEIENGPWRSEFEIARYSRQRMTYLQRFQFEIIINALALSALF